MVPGYKLQLGCESIEKYSFSWLLVNSSGRCENEHRNVVCKYVLGLC